MVRKNKKKTPGTGEDTKGLLPLSVVFFNTVGFLTVVYLALVITSRLVPPYTPRESVASVFDKVVTNLMRMVVDFVERHPEIGETFKAVLVWCYKIAIQAIGDCTCRKHVDFDGTPENITWAQ